MAQDDFYTLKGYRMLEGLSLTEGMEDYLEMICRLCSKEGFARIGELARHLHVSPPSASRMAQRLAGQHLVSFARYGIIQLTDEGLQAGRFLLWRHAVLDEFLRLVNGTDDETRQAEQIEHFFNAETLRNIERLNAHLIERPLW